MTARTDALRRYGVCLVAGALMACATPPMNVYPLAWIGMIPFAWLLARASRPPAAPGVLRSALRAGSMGLVFAFGTNLVALRFAATVVTRFAHLSAFVGPLALGALAALEATRWGAAGVVYSLLVRLGLPRAGSFAVGVYAGTFVPTMIPWTVACGVCPWPATVQLAECIGERGVAMIMALEAALAAEALGSLGGGDDRPGAGGRALGRRNAARALAACGGLLVGTLVYGAWRVRSVDALRSEAAAPRVALVEAAVSATERWRDEARHALLSHLTALTLDAERDGADLVVWPEAAYPFTMPHVSRHPPRGDMAVIQDGVRGPVMTGLIMTGDLGKYNSAVVATRDGLVSEPYDKIHRMWFGEFVPFADTFPWLRKAFARGIGLRAGERSVALTAGPVRAGLLICLEDILPDAGREAIGTGANLLVNVTNDAWFEGTAESELHLRLARLRSVELRRDLVRAVNGGPTTWVDAVGRIVAELPADRPGVLMTRPALLEAPFTVYARWGDAPFAVLVGAWTIASASARARRLRAAAEAEL
ncbi:MAG TPA: apolipoprotein N-acyltransferase [Polyangiaceae bacterium]|nr:apolipoprotein N-acyltransferase [Polyangiaceae bacterium]